MIEIKWQDPIHCVLYASEYIEPEKMINHHIPDSSGKQREIVTMVPSDVLATEEKPYIYNVEVKPLTG